METVGLGFYFEDLPVGRRFRTIGRTVTEADITNFVNCTGMVEVLFTNTEFLREESDIKQRLAPAALSYCFAEGLLVQATMQHTGFAFLHMELNVEKAVFAGDTIHVECEVIEARLSRNRPGRGLVRTRNQVVKQDGSVALTYTPLRMTAAIMAGLDHARGDIIVPIDADLQNDPADIPRLLEKLEEGYDVVSGWRVDRQDAAIRRNLASRIANSMISRLSGVHLHDYGCSLKAYRRNVIGSVRLYGEMHRFVPIYAAWYGARITEIPVNHSPRLHGRSNYGLERILKVVLDLMVVRFLDRWIGKPIYVFGGFGALWFAVAAGSFFYMLYLKFFARISMIQTPLPLLVVMSIMMGVMSICIGLVAEIVVRTYFESQGKSIYYARELINFDAPPSRRAG